jgi:hypothetical protein
MWTVKAQEVSTARKGILQRISVRCQLVAPLHTAQVADANLIVLRQVLMALGNGRMS